MDPTDVAEGMSEERIRIDKFEVKKDIREDEWDGKITDTRWVHQQRWAAPVRWPAIPLPLNSLR